MFDSDCYELAVKFLDDEHKTNGGAAPTQADKDALAQDIQEVIEAFFYNRDRRCQSTTPRTQ